MGHSYRRTGVAGKPRYAAIFHDARGIRRSAGTFSTKKEADRAWVAAESDALLGNGHDPRRGKITFAAYVTGTWFPNHQLEDTSRQRYSYQINKYLIPEFGAMKMGDIAPVHVREWITRLKTADISASTIADIKTVLSAVFTTALNDQIVAFHPVRGVKTPTVARRPRTIVTPEQFDLIHAALPDEGWRTLIELDVETGLRWGELTELRVYDVNLATRMLTAARAVIEVNAPFRAAGAGQFRVKEYPKDKEYRRVKISTDIAAALTQHIENNRLGRDDLLFPCPPNPAPTPRPPSSAPPYPMTSTCQTTWAAPSRPPLDAPTPTAPCPATTSDTAAAPTVATPAPATAPPAARREKTTHATSDSAGPLRPTGTSPAAGSPSTSGTPPSLQPTSTSTSGSTTYATPTHRGSSPAEPTSRLSKRDWVTGVCAPPRNTSTRCPITTTLPWTH
jgi:integrase